jgi:hypothetical protein
MNTKDPADPQSLSERLSRMIDALANPQLSADGVVDLTYELADLAQKAALELELSGEREEAIDLYDRLARTLREAASQRPDDERYLVETVAEFWALTADSWRATAQPAPMPEPERPARATGYQVFDNRARSREQLHPGPMRSSTKPWVPRTDAFGPRAKPSITTRLPQTFKVAVSQEPGDQRQWLEAMRALSQARVTDIAISGEPKKLNVSKDTARPRQTLAPKSSK